MTLPRSTPARPSPPGGAGWSWCRRRSSARRAACGFRLLTPASLKGAEAQAAFAALQRRRRGGGGLWPAPAQADPRRAPARLLQPACLAAAALARRRADPPRDHGGRRRDRRHGDEDGRGPRHRPDGDGRAHADRARHDGRRAARRAGAARRRPDGAGAGGARARHAATHAAAGDGVTYAAKIDKAETRIDWSQAVARRCTTTSAACRRFPAPGSRSPASACKVLRSTKARAAVPPGAVLDDRLTVACGDGAVRLVELQRPASRRCRPRSSCAARRSRNGRGLAVDAALQAHHRI